MVLVSPRPPPGMARRPWPETLDKACIRAEHSLRGDCAVVARYPALDTRALIFEKRHGLDLLDWLGMLRDSRALPEMERVRPTPNVQQRWLCPGAPHVPCS